MREGDEGRRTRAERRKDFLSVVLANEAGGCQSSLVKCKSNRPSERGEDTAP